MTSLAKKLWVAGVVVLGAVGYLAYAGTRQGWVYYMPVNQYASQPENQKGRVRLMGTVAEEGIAIGSARMKVDFMLSGQTARVLVSYSGAIPDLFKPGVDVVVEGKLGQRGRFEADVLLTKCASKYDSKHKGAKEGDATRAAGGRVAAAGGNAFTNNNSGR